MGRSVGIKTYVKERRRGDWDLCNSPSTLEEIIVEERLFVIWCRASFVEDSCKSRYGVSCKETVISLDLIISQLVSRARGEVCRYRW